MNLKGPRTQGQSDALSEVECSVARVEDLEVDVAAMSCRIADILELGLRSFRACIIMGVRSLRFYDLHELQHTRVQGRNLGLKFVQG
mmetsp:Transcript_13248/g.20815  ORF Transcript_13248/g.20815 Transcript_13248/m.20815 type:complete len:87 (-) Transcript_13248:337-597(-)